MTEEVVQYQPSKEETLKRIESLRLQDEWVKSLLQATPEQFVKQRIVGGGKKADYIEGGVAKGTILERSHGQFRSQSTLLSVPELEALERMVGQKLPSGLILAWNTLEIQTPSGFISSATDIGCGEIKGGISQESVGQAIKGAVTDAEKRSAVHFGVALDLYSPGIYDDPEKKAAEEEERKRLLARLKEILVQVAPTKAAETLRQFADLSLEELKEKVLKGEEKLNAG